MSQETTFSEVTTMAKVKVGLVKTPDGFAIAIQINDKPPGTLGPFKSEELARTAQHQLIAKMKTDLTDIVAAHPHFAGRVVDLQRLQ